MTVKLQSLVLRKWDRKHLLINFQMKLSRKERSGGRPVDLFLSPIFSMSYLGTEKWYGLLQGLERERKHAVRRKRKSKKEKAIRLKHLE